MTTEETNTTADRADTIATEIIELGAIWARYGLLVGRSAVDAYARTLATTGRLIEHLIDAIGSHEPKTPSS